MNATENSFAIEGMMPGLKLKKALRVDFVIATFDENKNRKVTVIEADGSQHFKPWRYKDIANCEQHFKNQKDRDKCKNLYLLNKGFDIARIDYTLYHQKKIEKTLDKYFDNMEFSKRQIFVSDLSLYQKTSSMKCLFDD